MHILVPTASARGIIAAYPYRFYEIYSFISEVLELRVVRKDIRVEHRTFRGPWESFRGIDDFALACEFYSTISRAHVRLR